MLIKNLGQTRMLLLDIMMQLTEVQLNQKPGPEEYSISQVIYHLYTTEKETALLIINSINTSKNKVEEKDISYISNRIEQELSIIESPNKYFTKAELKKLLVESRFQYLQSIFNETHVYTLTEKSINHQTLGQISLKNLIDYIWLHENRHIEQIRNIIDRI